MYNEEIHHLLLQNPDYQRSLKNESFMSAQKGTTVSRIYKIESDSGAYAIVPFDRKKENGQMVTSLVIDIGLDGKFHSAAASNESSRFYQIRERWDALYEIWRQIYRKNSFVINNWPSFEKGYPLSPGYNTVAINVKQDEE